jgi:hypothetical protein
MSASAQANNFQIGRRWTDEETQRARSMKAAGAHDRQIAEALGRTIGSVKSRLEWITMSDERREKVRQRIREYRGEGSPTTVLPFHRPPAHVLEERDAAASLELTANMIVLGDPPPGRSMLDRARQHREQSDAR